MRASRPILAVLAVVFALGLSATPAATMPDVVRIPQKIKHGKGDPPDSAAFSHWAHDRFYCYTCHPSIFPQRPMGFTHEDIDAGRYCGRCHNGKTAFSPDADDIECELCHREPEWTPKWGRP